MDLVYLNYLCCVVREMFWMYFVGLFLIFYEFVWLIMINGYYIFVKICVFINIYGLGWNISVWIIDIEEFRLEWYWFVDGSGRVEISYGFDYKILLFSVGKRKCFGVLLGVMMVLMVLVWFFYCFDWILLVNIDMLEVYGMIMFKVKLLWVLVKLWLVVYLYIIIYDIIGY